MQTIRDVLIQADTAFKDGKLEDAVNLYEFVLCRNPSHDYALYCLGSVLLRLGREGVGMALLQRSIEENPKRPEALHNLGIGLRNQGHDEAAVKVYEMALEQQSKNVETISNLAGCFINRGVPEKCVEWADKGLAINPNHHSCKYHKALAYLELGKLEEGFRLYEHRKHIGEWSPRVYKHPYWDGKPVEWLLIHGEQGVGDEILFMSWLPKIRHLAKNIAIEATPRLVKLFERTFNCPV
ncbi:MAG TPA: CDC27 family protein, partial [Candidatus Binatia bacterium]|nr:CDC27 family protein [Candidatus Binatia bacterium]